MNIIDAIMGKNMAIQELTENGGVGYTEGGKHIVHIELDGGEKSHIYGTPYLEAGKRYTFKTDKHTYEGVCKEAKDGNNIVRYFGNLSLYLGDYDTGEYYVVAETYYPEAVTLYIASYENGDDEVGDSYMDIYEAETVHTIDPKYLPEGGVGYTEEGKNVNLTAYSADNAGPSAMVEGRAVSFVEGQKYKVTVNHDIEQIQEVFPPTECVAKVIDGVFYYIGNASIIFGEEEGPSTGEWFCVVEYNDNGHWVTFAVMYLEGAPNAAMDIIVSAPETVHTIEPVYLEEAMPKIVDLTKFNCMMDGTTLTFNDALLGLVATSLQSDAPITKKVTDVDRKLQKAIDGAKSRNIIFRIFSKESNIETNYPASIGIYTNGGWVASVQITSVGFLSDLTFEYTASIGFEYGGDSESASVFIVAKLIT